MGKKIELLKDHADFGAQFCDVCVAFIDALLINVDFPACGKFEKLMDLKRVDFPEPEGPMMARTSPWGDLP